MNGREIKDVGVNNRTASIALMFAEIHCGDSDCLGIAAKELRQILTDKGINSQMVVEEFDC